MSTKWRRHLRRSNLHLHHLLFILHRLGIDPHEFNSYRSVSIIANAFKLP